jgi:hypothetical protein
MPYCESVTNDVECETFKCRLSINTSSEIEGNRKIAIPVNLLFNP